MEYVVIFEEGENSCSAYVPDLPVCLAAGETMEEVSKLIAEAIEFHIEGLRENGDVVPPSSSSLPVQSDPGVSSALITVHVYDSPEHTNLKTVLQHKRIVNFLSWRLFFCPTKNQMKTTVVFRLFPFSENVDSTP